MNSKTFDAENAEEQFTIDPDREDLIRVATHVRDVEHFFDVEGGLRDTERLAEGEVCGLIHVINEVTEVALKHDSGTVRSAAWRLKATLDEHHDRDTLQAVRVESRTDTTDETVHDVAAEREGDEPTVTVRLSRNQALMVSNALGEDALQERDADRMANFRARWDLRETVKDALESELEEGGSQ